VVLSAAEEEAARMRAEAETAVKRQHEELLLRTEVEATQEARTRIAAARLRGRDSVLAEKRMLIERALTQVIQRIDALPDEQYASLIAGEVAVASRGGETLFLGVEDADRLRMHLANALADADVDAQIAEHPAAFARGVLLESGRTRVEVSASTIVASRREELETLLMRALFETEAEEENDG